MSWESSKALTALKRDFLRRFSARHQEFWLTGGSALGIFYLQHRISYDLDFFTSLKPNWLALEESLRAVAQEMGAELRTVTASPTFHRYELRRGEEREILDFAVDSVPQLEPEKAVFDGIRVDTLKEIAVNKICTLIERSELKDLVDLYFLEKQGHCVEELLSLARKKEAGLDPAMLSFLLSQVDLTEPLDYLLVPLDLEDFRAFIRRLQRRFAELAYPGAESRGRGEPRKRRGGEAESRGRGE